MKYHKRDNTWFLSSDVKMDVRDVLAPGNYTVCRHPLTGEYFLEESEPFTLPPTLYGKTAQWSERILKSFRADRHQTGVLLSGTKGSGKTLLAKHIALTSGLPVIIVNQAFSDDRFLRTLQSIEQPAVIIFDEFEKVYDKDDQDRVLTLFDGVYTATNKVMILTCNDRHAVREHFHNRPGRLRYAIEFRGLDAEFIRAYCRDNLLDGAYLREVLKLSWSCDEFNFDMLQAVVRELNDYGGTVPETVEILNVKPLDTRRPAWRITVTTPALPDLRVTTEAEFEENPVKWFSRTGWDKTIYVRAAGTLPDGNTCDERAYNEVEFRLEHLTTVDSQTGAHTFELEVSLALEGGGSVALALRITVALAETPSAIDGLWDLEWREAS